MTKLSFEQHKHVFNVVYGLCNNEDKADLEEDLSKLPEDAFEKINNLVSYDYPIYDIKEDFPEATADVSDAYLEFLKNTDIEDFLAGTWFNKDDI